MTVFKLRRGESRRSQAVEGGGGSVNMPLCPGDHPHSPTVRTRKPDQLRVHPLQGLTCHLEQRVAPAPTVTRSSSPERSLTAHKPV